MKTIGERIRQAREQRGMSQADLGIAAGFKGQSAIGNLENRATGRGGFSLPRIAAALDVPITWLLNGPDADEVPFISKGGVETARDATAGAAYTELDKAIVSLRRLPPKGLREATQFLEFLTAKYTSPSSIGADHPISAPASKAA